MTKHFNSKASDEEELYRIYKIHGGCFPRHKVTKHLGL